MLRHALLTIAAVITLAALSPAVVARSPDLAQEWGAPAIAWRDIASGIREATKTKKPVVMVFHAPWCTACRTYREVFRDPRIIEASRAFVMILIDADADKVANGAFSPDGTYVPRTIFLDWEGNVRTEFKGSNPQLPHEISKDDPTELLGLMERAAKLAPDAPAVEKQASD